jgi:hypothetical protein
MARKKNVIEDELGIRGAGLYCIMPYERLDSSDKCVFKIGMTAQSFKSRIEIYHSYYPLGVYMVCFLKNPPVRNSGFRKRVTLYLHIERWIMEQLKNIRGTYQLTSTARIKNLNVNSEGETEFFYSSEKHIHDIFERAKSKFGGELIIYNLDGINDTYEKNMKTNKKYVAEIIFPFKKINN